MVRSTEIYRRRIDQVIDHLHHNLDRAVPLEELASVACFSPFHFHRIFVAVMGETVNAFSNRLRNEKAARLLRFTPRPITQIAAECGFSSAATLTRSFNQYFGVSPGRYRKGDEIQNSKIRKDLQPVTAYHCNLTEEELEQLFPVQIRQLPERRIAYIRVVNAFKKGVVIQAFSTLISWAKDMGWYDNGTIFGMSKDDPEVTPKEKYSYEACLTVPGNFKADPESVIQTTVLPACKYAFTKVSGDMNLVGAGINFLFDHWLIRSDYECETQPGLEIFLNKAKVTDWSHFDLELGIPVKRILDLGTKR